MTTMGIVPSFNELKHGQASLIVGAEGVAVQQLTFQGSEEALTEGIIDTIADCNTSYLARHIVGIIKV